MWGVWDYNHKYSNAQCAVTTFNNAAGTSSSSDAYTGEAESGLTSMLGFKSGAHGMKSFFSRNTLPSALFDKPQGHLRSQAKKSFTTEVLGGLRAKFHREDKLISKAALPKKEAKVLSAAAR